MMSSGTYTYKQTSKYYQPTGYHYFTKNLCCWICCACLVLCNQCISTGTIHEIGKHTISNWLYCIVLYCIILVLVNLSGWLFWMLHNATCTALINVACNTHNEVEYNAYSCYSCYSHYGSYHSACSSYTCATVWRIYPVGTKY